MTKANQYIKLHKKASSNILGIPAWGSRVKVRWLCLFFARETGSDFLVE